MRDVFSKYGPIDNVQIVYDAQTGRSRGFAFVYFENKNHAAEVEFDLIFLEYKLNLIFKISNRQKSAVMELK